MLHFINYDVFVALHTQTNPVTPTNNNYVNFYTPGF